MPNIVPPSLPATLEDAYDVIIKQAAIIEQLSARIETLEARIEELTSQQNSSSRNSSKPPSSDSPEQRGKRRKKKPSDRARGGQPGHPKQERALVPEAQVDEIHHYFPEGECGCGGYVQPSPEPTLKHQVFDLPDVTYRVDEYRLYQGHCQVCGKRHVASLPDWIPSGQMGAGLIAWITLLSGQFHLSMRKIQRFLQEQWSLPFSLGAISQAQGKATAWMEPVHHDLGEQVREETVAHADETRHFRGKEMRWFWALTTTCLSFFMVHNSRGKLAANILLGGFKGYLVTDHYSAYNGYPRDRHQLCWAHLMRHFIKMGERGGQAGLIGRRLYWISCGIFRAKKRYQKDKDSDHYHRKMNQLRRHFQRYLKHGAALQPNSRTARQCTHLLNDEDLCWTFLNNDQVPLTNNQAERDIRGYVIWRKLSFASQSFQGDRFRPMVLSLVETAQKMGVSSYVILRQICEQGLTTGNVTFRLKPNSTLAEK